MTEIAWNENLSVGVDLIDDQHKELIKRIRNLSQAVERRQAEDKVLTTLDFMIEYTDFHFGTEERYMHELDYPQKEQHMRMHREFRSMLDDMVRDFEEEGATSSLGESIHTYLMNWLVKHIQGTDVGLGVSLREKGIDE